MPDGQLPDPGEVVWHVRAAWTVAELNSGPGVELGHLIEAYRTVLEANEQDLIQALQ